MKPKAQASLHKLAMGNEEFLYIQAPDADSSLEALIATALKGRDGAPPDLLYWDGRLPAGGLIHFGRGGLDPVLASQCDLSKCIAIRRQTLDRLVQRKAISSVQELGRAAALLARAPGVASLWCEGLAGDLDLAGPGPLAASAKPATAAETISLCLIASGPNPDVEPFLAALRGQVLASPLDVVAISFGLDSAAQKALASDLDTAAAADPRLKIRRYSLTGTFGMAYLANMGVALSQRDAVIVASADCVPVTPNALQRLADWALSGDIVAACPRIVFQQKLIAAGLAFGVENGEEVLRPWSEEALSDCLRIAAAPAPLMFALRRSSWIEAGGARGVATAALWSAEFAFGHGPKGRTLLVGSEVAEWIGPERPFPLDSVTLAHQHPQPSATVALRDPVPIEPFVAVPESYADGSGPRSEIGPGRHGDAFPSSAPLRLLVVADALGASQAIPFLEGLKDARASGAVAVRIVGEGAFPSDVRGAQVAPLDALVEDLLDETDPHIVVASRLGHLGAWNALQSAARRRLVPIIFHIDDDLVDLPAAIGLERWRKGRNPRRMRALMEGLAGADFVLASTPALAEVLRDRLGRDQVLALTAGAAGRPRPRPVRNRPRLLLGYMGSASHEADLQLVGPALESVLASYPQVEVVLFGSIAEQPTSLALKGRIQRVPPVLGSYAAFRDRLADLSIDIALAPLQPTLFNQLKTPTKWVEYADAGAAVVASPLGPYRPLTAGGAALAAQPNEWESALRRMIESPILRAELVERADAILAERFGWDRLEADVLGVLNAVRGRWRAAA